MSTMETNRKGTINHDEKKLWVIVHVLQQTDDIFPNMYYTVLFIDQAVGISLPMSQGNQCLL